MKPLVLIALLALSGCAHEGYSFEDRFELNQLMKEIDQ